jgi:very-short-patch-repair endonuclease
MRNRYASRTIICQNCGKEHICNQSKDRKFCSRKCFYEKHASDRKTGENIKCENCHKEVYQSKTRLKNNTHHFCSLICANKFQARNKLKFICKTCNNIFYWSSSRITQANVTYCSISCRNEDDEWIKNACVKGNFIQSNKKGLNKLELLGNILLKKYNIVFENQVLIHEKILVDVFIKEWNLIIQWDGEYWHGHPSKIKNDNPDKRQSRRMNYDKSQDLYLKKCGYKILRFWENEVIKECKEESDYIKRTIQEVARTSEATL